MTTEATLQSLLAPLAAGGCWPMANTSSTITHPYIVFHEIVAMCEMLDGEGLDMKRYQIDCFAKSYGAAKALANSVRSAISGSALSSVFLSSMDGEYNDAVKDYQIITEFKIWAEE
jgi:hypothetical protein